MQCILRANKVLTSPIEVLPLYIICLMLNFFQPQVIPNSNQYKINHVCIINAYLTENMVCLTCANNGMMHLARSFIYTECYVQRKLQCISIYFIHINVEVILLT